MLIGAAAVIGGIASFVLTALLLLNIFEVAALLPASIVGASVVSMAFPRKSVAVSTCYLVPTTAAYFAYPMLVAAMSDGHPGKVMLWLWASIPHVALSLSMIWLVRALPSLPARLAAPVIVITLTSATAYAIAFTERRNQQSLIENTESSIGPAFERDLLPHLLAVPDKVAWSAPVTWDEPKSQCLRYTMDGVISSRKAHVRLSGLGAYSAAFDVTLPASDFQVDLKDRVGLVRRAKEWLKSAGVSKEQFEDLKIEVRDLWDPSHNNSGRIVTISPGKGHVTIAGYAEYDPISKRFSD